MRFGARADMARGFTERLIQITETMLIADVYAALRYLDGLPEVDGDRVALIGFSYGGMAATYAAHAQVAERFAPNGARFAGHVAFYAPCVAQFDDGRSTGAPVLFLIGDGDAIVDQARCAEVSLVSRLAVLRSRPSSTRAPTTNGTAAFRAHGRLAATSPIVVCGSSAAVWPATRGRSCRWQIRWRAGSSSPCACVTRVI